MAGENITLAKLLVEMGVDSKDLKHGFEEAAGHGSSMSKQLGESLHEMGSELGGATGKVFEFAASLGPAGIAAAALAGAIVESVEHFSHFAHELEVMKAQTGFMIEGLQQVKFAADASGSSIEKIAGMATKLDSAIEKGSPGLEKLGLDLNELKNSNPEAAFHEVMAALVEMPNEIDKIAIAREVFGRSGASALEFAENLNHLTRVADEAGIVMGEKDVKAAADFAGGMKELSSFTEGMSNQFAAGVLQGTDLKGTVEDLAPTVKMLGEAFHTAGAAISELFAISPAGWLWELNKMEFKGIASLKDKISGSDFENYAGHGTAAQQASLEHSGAPKKEEAGDTFSILDDASYDAYLKKNKEIGHEVEKNRGDVKRRNREAKEAASDHKKEMQDQARIDGEYYSQQDAADKAFERSEAEMSKLRLSGIAKYNEAIGSNASALDKQKAAIDATLTSETEKNSAVALGALDQYVAGTKSKEAADAIVEQAEANIKLAKATHDASIEDAESADQKKKDIALYESMDRLGQNLIEQQAKQASVAKQGILDLADAFGEAGSVLKEFGVSGSNAFVQILGGIDQGIHAGVQFAAAMNKIYDLHQEGKSASAGDYAQAGMAGVEGLTGMYKNASVLGGAASGASMGLSFTKGASPLAQAGAAVVGAGVGAVMGLLGNKAKKKKELAELSTQIERQFGGSMDKAKIEADRLGVSIDKAFSGTDVKGATQELKDFQDTLSRDAVLKSFGQSVGRVHAEADRLGVSMDKVFSGKDVEGAKAQADMLKQALQKSDAGITMSQGGANEFMAGFSSAFKAHVDTLTHDQSAAIRRMLADMGDASDEARADAVKRMQSGFADDPGWKISATAVATSFMAAFNASVQEKGLSESVKIFSDQFQAFRETLQEVGGDSAVALLGPMSAQFDLAQGPLGGLVQMADGLRQMLVGVSDAGYLDANSFAAMQATAASVFDQMVAGGADASTAIHAVAPDIAAAMQAAEKMGVPLSAEMQHLKDIAEQNGITFDTDPMNQMVTALEHIVDILANQFPAAAAAASASMKGLGDAAPSGPGGTATATNSGDIPEFAGGGTVSAPPGGGLAILHNNEAVVPLNSDGSMGGRGVSVTLAPTFNVQSSADPRELAAHLVEMLERDTLPQLTTAIAAVRG